jgi:hypothetical protein
MQVDANVPARSYRREASDNMGDGPIKRGNAWTPYSVVLDVPMEATHLTLGLLLRGKGTVWLDDLTLEVVGEEVPTTDVAVLEQPHPAFDQGLTGWRNTHGSYETTSLVNGTEPIVARLTQRVSEPTGVGRLSQPVLADTLRGKQYRFSATVRATLRLPSSRFHGIHGSEPEPGSIAGIWVRVTGPNSSLLYEDMMAKDPIKDVTDWTRYSLDFTVPDGAIYVSYGVYLYGVGTADIREPSLDELK